MIKYLIGDLLQSEAECLVNGVNCEGFMGKGIAFQFKKMFPTNYQSYVEACHTGKCTIGKVFFCNDGGKLIANFPSKNKWRQSSHLNYIKLGLDSLVQGLEDRKIKTVAIPPLGCGNGGLNWVDVKRIIEEAFLSTNITVYLYEPVGSESKDESVQPVMTTEHLVLLKIANNLKEGLLDMLHLEAAAFMMNVYRGKEFFSFENGNLSSKQIASLSKDISLFKCEYSLNTTTDAETLLYSRIISKKVQSALKNLEIPIRKATIFVNNTNDGNKLKATALLVNVLKEEGKIKQDELLCQYVVRAEKQKINLCTKEEIEGLIDYLVNKGIIERGLFGLSLVI